MYSVKEYQALIETALSQQSFNSKPAELYEPIKYTLSLGGKRMRPVLVLMGCNLFNDNIQPALNAAVGIEVFHNFTLLHDDIMDNAPLRRNQPTVHAKWNSNIAILSGDTMFVKAYQLMMQVPDDKLRAILDLYNITAIEVCEGQQLDMNFETRSHVAISDYLKMIELKTAVLLGCSLKCGAIIGGAREEDAQHLYEFGKNIGIAFQLQDDILDVYGSAEKFGKQVGGDIISNKKTFLLLRALQLVQGYHKEELNLWLQAKEFSATEKVKAVTDIYNFFDIKTQAKQEMIKFYTLAMENLEQVLVSEERKKDLQLFADNLMEREI